MVRAFAKIVLVATILLVAVPSTQAAEIRTEDRAGWSVARAWFSLSFFADWWDAVAAAWGDNGCVLDPSGGCRG